MWGLLLILPVVGAVFGFFASGLLGVVIGALILALTSALIITVASFFAARRLPIHIEIIPSSAFHGIDESGVIRLEHQGRSQVSGASFWSRLTANNYGDADHRITGLVVEFQKPFIGVWPQTIARVRCLSQRSDENQIDWLLPKSGRPETRLADFVHVEYLKEGVRLEPGEEGIRVRVVAEVGSPRRRVYVPYDGDVAVRG